MADILLAPTSSNTQDTISDELRRTYYENRILVLNDEIDDFVIDEFGLWILEWNREDKEIPVNKRKPIRLYVDSPGGNSFCADIMADIIMQSKTPIIGVGLSLVASAAYIIFLACGERVCFPNSSFLQHEGEISIENSRTKLNNTIEYFNNKDARCKEYILSRTNMSSEFYDETREKELWMDAKTAKEFDVVHKIVGEDVDIDYVL